MLKYLYVSFGGEFMTIDVLVEVGLHSTFTYLVPVEFESKIEIGKRVQIPFGSRTIEGFILNINKNYNDQQYELKKVISVIDDEPVLNEEMLSLGSYMSDYYFTSLIKCYQVMLPVALKARNKTKIGKKTEVYIVLNKQADYSNITNEKQLGLIQMLGQQERIKKSIIEDKYALKVLLDKGILLEEKNEVYRLRENVLLCAKPTLTEEQTKAVEQILETTKMVTLIRGVTGSGKTEVYMNVIEKMLEEKKTAILLVPEISLTTQLIDYVRSRFGDLVAVLHSALSDGEKYDEWRRIVKEEAKVVVGARSAIFAPLHHIGVIIIDEEHETTYKQDHDPMYHVLDIALKRSETHHAKIILGSATPSIESYARAKKGYYHLIELEKRINRKPLPHVCIVSMEEEMKTGNRIFSSVLKLKLKEAIDRGEQAILLHNRRGYSSVLTCMECGHTFRCPHCEITLTYHKINDILRCHYCGYAERKHTVCPTCKSPHLRTYGLGTEKIEEELNKIYPSLRIIRMDLDTTSTKGAHGRIIRDFNDGKYDVLLGTQMIAKGLNFKKVTLVGVVDADVGLSIPDFRSGERTFALLSQVAGRSGRDELTGEVIFQTFNKDHYVIQMAKEHNYIGFYQHELEIRRKLNYPPYCFVCVVKIMSKDYEVSQTVSKKVGEYLRKELPNHTILGPTVAALSKIKNVYYFQCIIKYKNRDEIKEVMKNLMDHYSNQKKIKIEVDMNSIKV